MGPAMHGDTTAPFDVRLHDDRCTYTGTQARGGATSEAKGKGATPTQVWPVVQGRMPGSPTSDRQQPNSPGSSAGTAPSTPQKLRPACRRSTGLCSTPIIKHTNERQTLEGTFDAYCGQRAHMDSARFAKFCKDCSLLDEQFGVTDADLIFTRVSSRVQKQMGLKQFKDAVALIAERKSLDAQVLRRNVATLRGPMLQGTSPEAVRLHDDRSGYTGVHSKGIGGPNTDNTSPTATQKWQSSLRLEPGQTAPRAPLCLDTSVPSRPSIPPLHLASRQPRANSRA